MVVDVNLAKTRAVIVQRLERPPEVSQVHDLVAQLRSTHLSCRSPVAHVVLPATPPTPKSYLRRDSPPLVDVAGAVRYVVERLIDHKGPRAPRRGISAARWYRV